MRALARSLLFAIRDTPTSLAGEMDELEKTIQNTAKLLRQRQAELEGKEQELKRQHEAFEKDHPNHGAPSDVLRLNIGGLRRDVLRRTLTQYEGSLLASKFSGRWDDSLEKDTDGNFFIDQPERLFLPLLDYLRAKQCETPLSLISKPPIFYSSYDFVGKKEQQDFETMVEYYGLTLAVYPFGLYQMNPAKNRWTDWKLLGEGCCKIESKEWSTYVLCPLAGCHSRAIESYEVTLDDCSAIQVGFIRTEASHMDEYLESNTDRGVGYGYHSLALDCVKGTIASKEKSTTLVDSQISAGIGNGTGTIVRSEQGGRRWYVNGTCVAKHEKPEDGQVLLHHPFPDTISTYWAPCISIKGSCTISCIELTFSSR